MVSNLQYVLHDQFSIMAKISISKTNIEPNTMCLCHTLVEVQMYDNGRECVHLGMCMLVLANNT